MRLTLVALLVLKPPPQGFWTSRYQAWKRHVLPGWIVPSGPNCCALWPAIPGPKRNAPKPKRPLDCAACVGKRNWP